jgi:hypothetical protein
MSGTWIRVVREIEPPAYSPVIVITVSLSACFQQNHEDQREKLGELLNVSSLRCPDGRHWCRWEQLGLISSVINVLPPLRELDLDTVPYGIRDGQLSHLETLRVCSVEDWSWLVRETTASLKCLHVTVSSLPAMGGVVPNFFWVGRY